MGPYMIFFYMEKVIVLFLNNHAHFWLRCRMLLSIHLVANLSVDIQDPQTPIISGDATIIPFNFGHIFYPRVYSPQKILAKSHEIFQILLWQSLAAQKVYHCEDNEVIKNYSPTCQIKLSNLPFFEFPFHFFHSSLPLFFEDKFKTHQNFQHVSNIPLMNLLLSSFQEPF